MAAPDVVEFELLRREAEELINPESKDVGCLQVFNEPISRRTPFGEFLRAFARLSRLPVVTVHGYDRLAQCAIRQSGVQSSIEIEANAKPLVLVTAHDGNLAAERMSEGTHAIRVQATAEGCRDSGEP
jgi:hypothetical protein